MNTNKKRGNATILGVGAAACAVCCAGPILGVLAAIGLGTAAGFVLVGSLALLVGAAATTLVVLRHRRRAPSCAPLIDGALSIELADPRRRSG